MKIDVLGTAFMDVVFQTPESGFEVDNVVFSNMARISAGGNGCNLAINLAQKEVETKFYGYIGDDYPGSVIIKDFVKNNVTWNQNCHESTGISLVLVDQSGERSVTSYQGMNDEFELSAAELEALDNDIAVCGLGLLPQLETDLKPLIARSHSNGHTIYVGTTGDTNHLYQFIKEGKYSGLDFLFMNNLEAQRLCQLPNLIDCGKELVNECGIKNVIITEGEGGATMISQNDVYHVDANKVNCVDSTGAGDAFMAGFIAQYSSDHDRIKSLIAANNSGGENVQFFGAVRS